VRRALGDGFELDEDRERIDVAAVHRYLAEESYWAAGRSLETSARLIAEATRVVGLYRRGRQVGFARVVSDCATVAYLADVYVLPECRGRGLGVALVREAVEGSELRELRWLLQTADAHAFYARLGFGQPSERLLERPPEWGRDLPAPA
jgi:GNAT superfamily N-acetyltransferase